MSAPRQYVVELENGVWLCDEIKGDPGRTVVPENATRYRTLRKAEEAMTRAKQYRMWPDHLIRLLSDPIRNMVEQHTKTISRLERERDEARAIVDDRNRQIIAMCGDCKLFKLYSEALRLRRKGCKKRLRRKECKKSGGSSPRAC